MSSDSSKSSSSSRSVFENCSGGAKTGEPWHQLVCGHIISTRPHLADCGPNCVGDGEKPSRFAFNCPACINGVGRQCRMFNVVRETTRTDPVSPHSSSRVPDEEEPTRTDVVQNPAEVDAEDRVCSHESHSSMDVDKIDDSVSSPKSHSSTNVSIYDDGNDDDKAVSPHFSQESAKTATGSKASAEGMEIDIAEDTDSDKSSRWDRRSPRPATSNSSDDNNEKSFHSALAEVNRSPKPQPQPTLSLQPYSNWRWVPTGRRQLMLEAEMDRLGLTHHPYRRERAKSRSRSPQRNLMAMRARDHGQPSPSPEREGRSRYQDRVDQSQRVASRQLSTSWDRQRRRHLLYTQTSVPRPKW